jgi:hypothetical protein
MTEGDYVYWLPFAMGLAVFGETRSLVGLLEGWTERCS